MLRKAIITTAILLLVCICPAQAQSRTQTQSRNQPPKADSVISLLNAEWAKLVKMGFSNFRLIKGPAAFYHNGAYLFCDSAAWNIDREVIKAYGKVRLVQDNTVLRSDSLTYLIDQDLAQFRGPLVEVFDNEGDTLRTNNLDYNTKDSLAIFRNGGAMKDKDGNVIEGLTGIYTSSLKTFSFQENVQMFTDSIFLTTEKLDYLSSEKKAFFRDKTYVWRDNGFMKALAGWYDTDNEVIHFSNDVYINDPDYEMWADEVYYYRRIPRYEAYHNVIVLDTLNESAFVAHKAIVETDSLNNQHMEFTQDPAVFYFGENEEHVKDSLFVAADTLRIYTVRNCDIPEADKETRLKEREDILFDAIAEAEMKAEEERAKAKAEAEAKRPENIAKQRREKFAASSTIDSLAALGIAASDSLYKVAGLDANEARQMIFEKFGEVKEMEGAKTEESDEEQQDGIPEEADAMAAADTVGTQGTLSAIDSVGAEGGLSSGRPARDTTKIKYLHGWPNVRIFRSDIQLLCDSLAYSDVDSLARLHGTPVMWYKINNQLTSDIMILLMKDETLNRGSMQQNAMLVMQEDSVHFDQIKSTEMVGYFRDDDLYRYDALGGVNAMFYLKEKEEITTINIKESQFMTMALKNGAAQRIKYYEQTQSDAYPVYNLEIDKQRIKGFQWRGEERPFSRYDVTSRSLKPSEREVYDDVHMPAFRIADRYFNKYMSKVYDDIIAREEARIQARMQRDSIEAAARDSALRVRQDSLFLVQDSLVVVPDATQAVADSTGTDRPVIEPSAEAAPDRLPAGRRRRQNQEAAEETPAAEVPASEPQKAADQQAVTPAAAEPAAAQSALTAREQRILRKAERLIQRSDKRFFRKLYREVMKGRY
ncbi:MAG: hypothetical protein J6U34_02695 [Bacteroidales bacterium]|nr:hypothetical protein [Bacteroidales bacterium]